MGSKVLKPVFLRNIQIEGQELYFSLFENDIVLFPFHRFASSQVSPTHRSVFPAKPEHSAAPRARPRASPALATPTLVTAPAPAPPATPPLSMQVRATEVHRLHEEMELKCHHHHHHHRTHSLTPTVEPTELFSAALVKHFFLLLVRSQEKHIVC